MPNILEAPTLGGSTGLIASTFLFPNLRIAESRNSPLVAQNASSALISGGQNTISFSKLVLFVSTGPSNVTIKTLDGTSVTLSALASGTLLSLDVQFSLVTWTGTATATAYYTE